MRGCSKSVLTFLILSTSIINDHSKTIFEKIVKINKILMSKNRMLFIRLKEFSFLDKKKLSVRRVNCFIEHKYKNQHK